MAEIGLEQVEHGLVPGREVIEPACSAQRDSRGLHGRAELHRGRAAAPQAAARIGSYRAN